MAATAVYPQNIPQELRAIDNWLVWRYEQRDGKTTKPPWRADGGGHASSTDPATWTTFERALVAYESGDWDGIGIVLTADLGIVGVDLDKVDGWIDGATRILGQLDSYTEITPSGNGYRVYVRAEMPEGARRKGHVEIYNDRRFFTVSGDSISGEGVGIEERSAALAEVHREWLGRTTARPLGPLGQVERAPAPRNKLSDSDSLRLEKAMGRAHFAELWAGGSGGDHSADDLALANYLAFWWGGDPVAMDRMFRASGLMRDKWDSARGDSSYGAWTIARALEGRTEFYDPTPPALLTANHRPSGGLLQEAPLVTGSQTQGNQNRGTADSEVIPVSPIRSAKDILATDYPPTKFAVPGLLTEGCNILAGNSKLGKSWIALGIAVAIASQEPALGSIDCEHGDVLYLALEDVPRRIKGRLEILGADAAAMAHLDVITAPGKNETESPRADDGGLDRISGWLEGHPRARLVIVDTLQKFRTQHSRNGDLYAEDYDAVSAIKQVADAYSVAALVITHTAKKKAGDFLQQVTGTTGVPGAADGILVLNRGRAEKMATLNVTGRDIEEKEYALEEQGVGNWVIASETADLGAQSTIRRAIMDLLRAEQRPMGPTEVGQRLNCTTNAAKQRLWQMSKTKVLERTPQGYQVPSIHSDITHTLDNHREDRGQPLLGISPPSLYAGMEVTGYSRIYEPSFLPNGAPLGSNGVRP